MIRNKNVSGLYFVEERNHFVLFGLLRVKRPPCISAIPPPGRVEDEAPTKIVLIFCVESLQETQIGYSPSVLGLEGWPIRMYLFEGHELSLQIANHKR